jgi:hypothetical protein
MPDHRRNTPTEQNKEDNSLILYRLDRVEAAVKEVGSKVDAQDYPKRGDLIEVRETIVGRISEIRIDLQKQIDQKADQDQVDDLRSLVKAIGGVFATIIGGLIIYYLTNRR